MKRGEIWWADLEPARGREIRKVRPVVIMSAAGLVAARRTIVAIPLSTGPAPRPPVVVSVVYAGERSVAVCDQIRSLDRSRFLKQAGVMSASDLLLVSEALSAALDL
jgi:mRNA interferase MazF